MICVDKMADSNQDLLADQLTSFLAEVCEKGVVDVILGGPPCRKVSKLRLRRPGPPPLRARSGPERFALEDLSDAMRELAWNDAVFVDEAAVALHFGMARHVLVWFSRSRSTLVTLRSTSE